MRQRGLKPGPDVPDVVVYIIVVYTTTGISEIFLKAFHESGMFFVIHGLTFAKCAVR